MNARLWTRRQVVMGCAQLGAGAALAQIAAAQLPSPEPLHDDRLTLVTTTEASAWQKGEVFKPTFSWDMLNLNVDPRQAIVHARSKASAAVLMNSAGHR